MPEVHAILSASSSKRWLNCTPSARLEQNFPNESSVYAEEGTAAHALGEYKLRKYLHERVQRPTSEYENEEMEANTDIYAEFIISTVERIKETCPHPLVMVEERLDYSYLVPSGFGTGDCVIIADGTLYVMDYKNGKGVFVSCDHNPQMMLYALGAYHAYGYLYNIKQVSMTIIQPRLENISTYECSVEELLDWAETYVRPRAKLAFEGKGEQEYLDTTNLSVIIDMQAKLDQMVHNMITAINDQLCPNVTGPVGVTYQDANGNTVNLSDAKVLDTENCARGSDGELPPRELFVRAGIERYTEVTGSDGKTYYVYNEEDTSDTSYMYSLTSCGVNEELKKIETLFPHLKQNGEVDQQLGERLEALWNKDLGGLDPTDPDECNIEEYYQKMIGGLATVGNVYQKKAENLAGSVLTIENNRQQVIGVSSDEELQNMIKFQNAYNASSRFMTVISDMIEHIVTRLGNG